MEIIQLKYNWVGDFSNGLAPVKLEGKWGLVNKFGVEITPLKYNWMMYGLFSACVGLGEKTLHFNEYGERIW